MTSATVLDPPALDAPYERLHTPAAFARFVVWVEPRARRWLARWGVQRADRDDLLQEVLLRIHQRREGFEPERRRAEAFVYTIVVGLCRDHRRRAARREKHVEIVADLPDRPIDRPSPEDEVAQGEVRRLLEECLKTIDPESRLMLFAHDAEGMSMMEIAEAHDLPRSTAYHRYHAAKAKLQSALSRALRDKRTMGAAVLPISLEQLLDSEERLPAGDDSTVRRFLDRVAANDAICEARPGGEPALPRGPSSSIGRAVSATGRGALNFVAGAVTGSLVVYFLMRTPPAARTETAVTVDGVNTAVVIAPRSERPEPTTAEDAGAQEIPAQAAKPAPARAAEHDKSAEEQALFGRGDAAYHAGRYEDAIRAFQAHAAQYPGGMSANDRERLLIFSLYRAGRAAEARARLERLRRSNPSFARQIDAAMAGPDGVLTPGR